MSEKKTVLITGSLGLVGQATMEVFNKYGWIVCGIDNDLRSELFGVEKREITEANRVDIRDEKAVERVFSSHHFDAIIHTAAQPSHDWAKENPLLDFDVNARGTLILLEAARKYSPKAVFVYVSTDKVYGENMWRGDKERGEMLTTPTRFHSEFPYKENLGLDFAGKRSLFGCSKTAADIYVQEYGNYFGMKTVCFRPGCVTGKNHRGAEYHGFLAYLVKCIKEEIPYTIFGDERIVRDQIHATDLAEAFFLFVLNPKVGAVYNIGGGPQRSLSIREAIAMISEKLGKTTKIKYGSKREGDRIWDVHDVSKFKKDYPEWKYKYSLKDIINELCNEEV